MCRNFVGMLAVILAALFSIPAHAATITWSGAGTDWNTIADWGGGAVPGSADIAEFNMVTATQANVAVSSTAGSVWAATGVGQTTTIGATASGTLVLMGNVTTNGQANTAILVDNTGDLGLTINAPLRVVNSTSFLVNNASQLYIHGAMTITAAQTLTLGGTNAAGSILIDSGIAATTGAVNVSGSGTVILAAANSFTGGVTLTTGTLVARTSATALGTGVGTLVLNGGVLDLANASGTNLSFNRNTTVGGNTTIISDLTSGTAGNTYTLGTLSIGAVQLNINAGANVTSGTAGVTFGATTLTGNATVNTGGTNVLLTLGGITNGSTTTPYSLTLSGSGAVALTGTISDGASAGKTSLIINNPGGGLVTLSASNSFTGGITIQAGTLLSSSVNVGTLSTGTVTLGNTTGTNSAALLSNRNSASYANAIVLATNATAGALIVGNTGAGSSVTFTGGVTGTNNLILSENGSSGTLTFSTAAINNAGTVTNIGGGSGLTNISGGIGANVTGIIENSTTSALTTSTTALTVNNSVGTTLTNNNASGSSVFTVSSAVTGSGTLTLNNNSAIASGITLSNTSINNSGWIVNSGTGTGSVLISGSVGSNVTNMVQNSATSLLTLSTTNNGFGSLAITSGTVANIISVTGTYTNFGTGTITLGGASGSVGTLSVLSGNGGAVTFLNPIALGGGSAVGVLNDNSTQNGAETLSGAVNLNGTGLTLLNTSIASGLTLSGTLSGAANLITTSGSVGAITLSGLVNTSGSLTNNGTGTGTVTISGSLGSSMGNVVQTSTTSLLALSGSNNSIWGGSLLIQNGTVQLTGGASVGLARTGTGNMVLGTANSSANASLTFFLSCGGTASLVNSLISLASNDTGALTIQSLYTGANTGLTITSPVAMNGSNLTFLNTTGSLVTLSGSVTGVGNLTYRVAGNVAGITESGYVNNAGVINSIGTVTFSGTIAAVGNNTLYINPSYGTTTVNNALLGGTGGLVVAGGLYLPSSSGQSYGNAYGTLTLSGTGATFSGQTQINSGILSLNAAGVEDTVLGTSGTSATPILLGNTTGSLQAELLLNTANVLNRSITVQAGNAGNSVLALASTGTYAGSIALNKTTDFLQTANATGTVSGIISRGASAPGAVSLVRTGNNGTIALTASNSYNGGTVVGSAGILNPTVVGALGTGNVVVEAGLLLLTNTNATPGSIYVGPLGMLSTNIVSATLGRGAATSATDGAVLDKNSSGAFGINATSSGALNLAAIGNGNMWLGSTASVSYSASTLGANLDGNYRLGWNNKTLTISNSVLTGTGGLIVGGPQGPTEPSPGGQQVNYDSISTQGSITLSASNSYSGGTVVNPFSTLTGTALAAAGMSPFGSSTGTMTLHNSNLVLNNQGTSTTTTTVGSFSFDGNSQVTVGGVATGANTFALGSFTRNNNGTLTILPGGTGVLGSTAILTSTSALPTTVITTTSGTVGMLAPYISTTSGAYLTYGVGGTGFVPIGNAFTSTTAAGLSGTIASNAYVQVSGTTAGPVALLTSATIGVLSMSGSGVNITNSTGATETLAISAGGVNTSAMTSATGGNVVIGASGTNKGINLDFSGYAQDAVINASTNLSIMNLINAPNGLTKTGAGVLDLQAYNTSGTNVVAANTIGGTFTVNQGWVSASGTSLGTYSMPNTALNGNTSLTINSDSALGSANLLINGGGITTGGAVVNSGQGAFVLSASRTITIGSNGGTFGAFNQNNTGQNAQFANNIIVNSLVSGTGAYMDFSSTAVLAYANQTPSVFALTNTGNNFLTPINVYGKSILLISDPRQLGNSASLLTLDGGNASLQYGSAGAGGIAFLSTGVVPTVSGTIANPINFMNMGGGVDVVSTTVGASAIALTLSGAISGDGSFVKNGNGTLVLTAASGNTFSGSVNVNGGILSINDGSQLGLTTAVVSGTGLGAAGISGGAAYVQPTGELDLQNNIALGGTGGKTLYVSGTGVGGGGALHNLSGTNSNTGQVILQGNTTIATDAGSQLILSGTISNTAGITAGLTKTGSGTLVLSAANSYSGNTTVTGGTLNLSNSLALQNSTLTTGGFGLVFDQSVAGHAFTFGGLSGSGTLSLTDNGGNAVTLTVASNTTYSGAFSGLGNLATTGTSTLTLTSASTFSGNTTVTGGTLNLSNSLALQNSTVTTGGFGLVFDQSVAGHAFTFGGLSGSNGLALTDNGGNGVALTVATSGTALYSGTLSGLGGLTKSGSGTLNLTAINPYSGATSVLNGVLSVAANASLGSGTGAGVTVSNGGTLLLNNVNFSTAEALNINGTGYNTTGALAVSGTSSYAGAITAQTNATIGVGSGNVLNLSGGVTKNGTVLTFSGGGTVNINGVGISGTAANSDLVVDASTLVLNVANSYNGPTTVQNNGTLQLGASNVLPSAPATAMTLQSGGVLDVNGHTDTVASLTMNTGSVISSSGAGTVTSNGAITVNGASNVIGVNATISGTTAVNGSIVVHGAITGEVNVNNGGTLAGEGTVGSTTLNSGGTLIPGTTTGTGTLTTGNLTPYSGATATLAVTKTVVGKVAGTDFAQLSVAGTLDLSAVTSVSLGGGIKVTLQNVSGDTATFNPATDQLWTNIVVSSLLSGLSSFTPNAGNNFDQKQGQFAITDSMTGLALDNHFFLVADQSNGNALDLLYLASVPEPQTWALVAGGVGLLGFVQRLRRRIR